MSNSKQPDVDLFNLETQQCPYDAYKALRDEAPVYQCPETGMYIITRYEDVRRVLTDHDNFTNRTTLYGKQPVLSDRQQMVNDLFEKEGWLPAPTLAARDDPDHKAMRSVFNEAFRPGKIKAMDSEVEALAYRLIDDFIEDGHCEWVQQFAIPLPLFIIGQQMGADPADLWRIKGWTEAFFERISMMQSPDEELDTVRREIEAQHYFQPIFEQLRRKPEDSLLSILVNTVIEEWGRPMNDNELHAEMMADTFVGGAETTTNAIASGVKLLIENKNIWDQLKSDPDRYLKTFIEEVLRLESPVQSLMRAAAKDVEIGGTLIPKGSLINVRYAAANRDERRFDKATEIDLERKNAGGHMAFGSGKHHCLGAPLARRELLWSFTALLDRVDDLWFAEGKNEFRYHPHYLLRALKELHIEFRPAQSCRD
ncbi:putative cytochrome p450 107b1 [Luminiphilus syltensis NOR5-1B]|uniref:Putative cytochrome p450 107b1 n=1 Tax=Luminiphilus syltensis NOR5-1B TaxID=565045 RepID=B8KV69_9GAMM|nr:cytochrome P450 [Luminiphilus syltensis]EED34683.1 putative cytochrome p450 107b1 [Luminiphilus syltensis NOR5-1B]